MMFRYTIYSSDMAIACYLLHVYFGTLLTFFSTTAWERLYRSHLSGCRFPTREVFTCCINTTFSPAGFCSSSFSKCHHVFLFKPTDSFEVSLNGQLIYSKLETGSFPDTEEVSGLFYFPGIELQMITYSLNDKP